MPWQPIEDLPADWQILASPELPQLVRVWQEQADRLRNSGEFKTFMTQLRREIAIETGIIEQLYDLDRGITRLLIEQGINEALIPHGATNRPVKQVVALTIFHSPRVFSCRHSDRVSKILVKQSGNVRRRVSISPGKTATSSTMERICIDSNVLIDHKRAKSSQKAKTVLFRLASSHYQLAISTITA